MTAGGQDPIPDTETGNRALETPDEFLRQYGHLFGVSDPGAQLRERRAWTDEIGHSHVAFEQLYRDVPVFSGGLKVHMDSRGRVIAANGDVHPTAAKLDPTPSISKAQARWLAQTASRFDGPTVDGVVLVVVDPGWYGDPVVGPHLAYHVTLSDRTSGFAEQLFVDAHSGAILDQWDTTCKAKFRSIHDSNLGSNCCLPHGGLGCDEPDCEAAVCDTAPTCCDTEWNLSCAARGTGTCDELCWPGALARTEGDAPTGEPDVDAAYDYYGDTYDYFFRAFGRDGIDDLGLAMVATVNSPVAFCPNAFWSSSLQQMVFCTGTATDDIIAHELTHGVTQFTANLIYQNQPGQLNESYSDVFGELVDVFNGDAAFAGYPTGPNWPAHPTGPGVDAPNNARTSCSPADDDYPDGVRWLIGEDAAAFGGAIRDMWGPPCEGDPDRANSPLQLCSLADSGGVHSGSGIPNHAFALATDGGSFNGYEVIGVGPVKTGAVWYRALTVYLSIASDFQDAFMALNQAAQDLIGTTPNDPRTGLASESAFTQFDATQVDLALRAVEMDTRGRCGWSYAVLDSDPPTECADATVIYEDDFESGANGWAVSNTGPFGPPTPYDWAQTSEGLPFSRSGIAWHCEDRNIGDCDEQNESAVHSLMSPLIPLPPEARHVYASFTHYMESEPGWDGGHVAARVNGGTWLVIPATAFAFNPYNSLIRSGGGSGNDNPLEGEQGWTGVGGRWGRSVIDLSTMASGGDAIEFRFDFGKDGCAGYSGWYLDDFRVYACPDCNLNGVADHREFVMTAASGPLRGLGTPFRPTFTIESAPRAASDVTLTVAAIADLSHPNETVDVRLNGVIVETVFASGGRDCPRTPLIETVVIDAATFNAVAADRKAVITLRASGAVQPTACGDSGFISVFIEYDTDLPDENDNLIPDECENCAIAPAPAPEGVPVIKNRYVSFVPENPGRWTAYRLTPTDLPAAFAAVEGTTFWIGAPTIRSEVAGNSEPTSAGEATLAVAPLSCDPVFLDFSRFGLVHVADEIVVPGASYDIEAVDFACGATAEAYFSEPISVRTTAWGDVTGDCAVASCMRPDGRVDFLDIAAVVDKFRNLETAPSKTRTDLAPSVPDLRVDMNDV
ncbi:MAG: M4 family metallopeptidase, partial [Phycisphaerae bacterium]